MPPKRRRTALSPTRPSDTVGAHKQSQNPTSASALATAPVLPQEKQLLSLGLPTLDPTKRSSPPGSGEFLQACRWCRRKIGDNANIYMYGYLCAFCSPECREYRIKLEGFLKKHYSKSASVDKKDDPIQ